MYQFYNNDKITYFKGNYNICTTALIAIITNQLKLMLNYSWFQETGFFF